MKLKALIFDVDGTLAETEELHRQAFNRAFRDFDLDWHWDQTLYRRLLGIVGSRERIAGYMDELALSADHPLRLRHGDIYARKTEHYRGWILSGALSPRPGVERLIRDAMDNDIPVALATATVLANARTLLKGCFPPEIAGAIKVIGAGDMVARKKPAPDVYHHVIDRLGVSSRECLAIEDSRDGMRSAQAAGIPVLVTPGLYTADHDFAGASMVVSHLGDVDAPCEVLAGTARTLDRVTIDVLQSLLN